MDATQYTFTVNGDVFLNEKYNLIWEDKDKARECAAEYRLIDPDAEVRIVHRRVRYYEWTTTTP